MNDWFYVTTWEVSHSQECNKIYLCESGVCIYFQCIPQKHTAYPFQTSFLLKDYFCYLLHINIQTKLKLEFGMSLKKKKKKKENYHYQKNSTIVIFSLEPSVNDKVGLILTRRVGLYLKQCYSFLIRKAWFIILQSKSWLHERII